VVLKSHANNAGIRKRKCTLTMEMVHSAIKNVAEKIGDHGLINLVLVRTCQLIM
jgi:hypothetical protein